jgi:methyl-accepting chemotaxis protein
MSNEQAKNYVKRKQIIVNKEFQFRYMKQILFIIMVSLLFNSILITASVYFITKKSIELRLPNVMEQKLTSDVLINDINNSLIVVIPTIILICIIVFGIASIFLSHRIAGPLFKLERWLKTLSDGDFSTLFKLRRKDELKNFTQVIENVDVELSSRIKKIKELLEKSKANINNKEELTNNIKNIENIIGKFKTLNN